MHDNAEPFARWDEKPIEVVVTILVPWLSQKCHFWKLIVVILWKFR